VAIGIYLGTEKLAEARLYKLQRRDGSTVPQYASNMSGLVVNILSVGYTTTNFSKSMLG